MPKGVPRARKPARRAKPRAAGPKAPRPAPRGLVVSLALVAALGLTAALLALLSPAPLAPDVAWRLTAAADAPVSFDPVFDAPGDIASGRWTRIYIHHSNTPAGSASTLADLARGFGEVGPGDHFVIGNGQGAGDGELEVTRRWVEQLPAGAPALGVGTEADWISICLIGDFDRHRPTAAQRACLEQLLAELGRRLEPPPSAIVHLDQPDSSAGIGTLFQE